jgi:Helix-turn-helix domain
MSINIFSIMPVELWLDDRLTKTDLRVLGALLSFRNKTTNLCCPTREQISERTGLAICKISTSTAHLVELGWLTKTGNGGRSSSSKYDFCIPKQFENEDEKHATSRTKTVTDSVTVTEKETVTDLDQNGYRIGTKTVTDSVRGNITDNKQTITDNIFVPSAQKSEKFVKPTIQEIAAHIQEKNYAIDAEHFFNHYESNGWKVGKNPMKSWQSALVTWHKNASKFDRPQSDYQKNAKALADEMNNVDFMTLTPEEIASGRYDHGWIYGL